MSGDEDVGWIFYLFDRIPLLVPLACIDPE